MNTRGTLLYLVSTGSINSSILADAYPEVSDLGVYLRNISSYMASYKPIDDILLQPSHSVF